MIVPWQPIGDDGTRWWWEDDPERHLMLHVAGIMVESYEAWIIRYWPADPIDPHQPLLEAPPVEPDGEWGKPVWPIGVDQLPAAPATDEERWAAMEGASTWPRPEPPEGWGPL